MELRKTAINLSEDSRCSGRDLNLESPECNSRVLALDQPVLLHCLCSSKLAIPQYTYSQYFRHHSTGIAHESQILLPLKLNDGFRTVDGKYEVPLFGLRNHHIRLPAYFAYGVFSIVVCMGLAVEVTAKMETNLFSAKGMSCRETNASRNISTNFLTLGFISVNYFFIFSS